MHMTGTVVDPLVAQGANLARSNKALSPVYNLP